jgi:hypothetical protein
LRGLSPEQLVAQAVAQATGGVGAAILGTLSTAYQRVSTGLVLSGFCSCVHAACDPGDFLFNRGGNVDNDGTGYLTSAGENGGICEACGCTTSIFTTALAVSAVCLNL